jgi:hypothetical protein
MLFQVATTTALALRNDDRAVFDLKSHWAHQGNKPTRFTKGIFRHLVHERRPKAAIKYDEPHFHYAPIPYEPEMKLEGYFQSEKYFGDRREDILALLAPTTEQVDYLAKKYGALFETRVVSIHVRRGDYVKLADHHPPCTEEYYRRAIEIVGPARYFVFSDDIAWCKKAFAGPELTFVSEKDEQLEMYLMSMCHGHVIANSSFSWWGAWLNRRAEVPVVAPKVWFGPALAMNDTRDLVPERWTRI